MAMQIPPTSINPASTAFFFDFDGTLAEIVEDPRAVQVDLRVREALRRLCNGAGGAVAIISGRSVEQLDRMLHPLCLPAAGVHGIERRNAEGHLSRAEIDEDALARLYERVTAFVAGHPGLLAELKPGSVALHYRKCPEMESSCRVLAARLAREDGRIRVLHGKMVVELKLSGQTKADAIDAFMSEPPFAGRRPLFVGDDVTDEDGFAAVERRDGISIRIGDAETRAAHRLKSISAFHDWLVALSKRLPSAGPQR